MKIDFPQPDPHESEARITALLLGELSPGERVALEQELSESPELLRLKARLEQTIGLVKEAAKAPTNATVAAKPTLRLSDARREELLERFKVKHVAPEVFRKPAKARRDGLWVGLMAMAAVAMGLLTVVTFQFGDRSNLVTTPLAPSELMGRNPVGLQGGISPTVAPAPVLADGPGQPAPQSSPYTTLSAPAPTFARAGGREAERLSLARAEVTKANGVLLGEIPAPAATYGRNKSETDEFFRQAQAAAEPKSAAPSRVTDESPLSKTYAYRNASGMSSTDFALAPSPSVRARFSEDKVGEPAQLADGSVVALSAANARNLNFAGDWGGRSDGNLAFKGAQAGNSENRTGRIHFLGENELTDRPELAKSDQKSVDQPSPASAPQNLPIDSLSVVDSMSSALERETAGAGGVAGPGGGLPGLAANRGIAGGGFGGGGIGGGGGFISGRKPGFADNGRPDELARKITAVGTASASSSRKDSQLAAGFDRAKVPMGETRGEGLVAQSVDPNATYTATAGTLGYQDRGNVVGNFSALSRYSPDGATTLTNATIQIATLPYWAIGNLTVTNLSAPSAVITTISANTINAPTATLNSLTASGLTRGLFMPNRFGEASPASAQPEKKIEALGFDASGPELRVASAVSGPVALTQGLEDVLDREAKEKASVATTDRRLLRFSKTIPSLSNTEADKKGAVKAEVRLAEAAPPEPTPAGDDPAKPQTSPPVSPLIPQPEIVAAENSFSTFSLNVADVSFKLAAASLANGAMPDRNSIRSEEFVNALNYHDPEPPAGSPIGFTWERARYPFIQNREILRFAVQTAATGREANKPLNLVLLLDRSGSMERADRVRIVREAIQTLANQLKVEDRFSVVTFARTARLFADGVTGDKAGTIVESLSGITPEGGTNLEDALRLGYETASRHFQNNGVNRVILFTDGAANLGDLSPESLRDRVETWRKRGVALDCFGIGWDGLNDDLLEKLSRNGDGRYGFLNSPEEAGGEFANKIAGALHVAAADVKVQVEFNPQRVNLWRQIGYATHQLTKEQFRDNKVDAAELAAAESGNALYLAETKSDGSGPIATVHVRHRDPGTGLFQEHEWRIPYDGPAPLLERAPATLRLATTAAAFSEWLSGLPYAAEATPDRLLQLIQGLPSEAGPDRRPQELETMIQQARSLVGK